MTARVILARHGNTFKPEETPVWVGARTDAPLVEKGIAQAHALGSALRRTHTAPDVIITGPLQRTCETARIVADVLNLPAALIRIDARLTEIDYGAWEGLSTTEIESGGGGEELAAWNNLSTFPTSPAWMPSEPELLTNTQSLLGEIQDNVSLIVTSNGILRFFARAAVNCGAFQDRKVATGHICVMEHVGNHWHILHWNVLPAVLAPAVL